MDAFAVGGRSDEFVAAFQGAPAGMIVIDRRGRITQMNPRAVELAGALVGREAIELVASTDRGSAIARIVELWQVGHTEADLRCEVLDGRGATVPVQVHASRQPGGNHVVLYLDDVRDRLAVDARLDLLTRFDAVTGLPNRSSITEQISAMLADVGCDGMVAVHAVDVDRFRVVNDQMGHDVGDLVLSTLGRRLVEVAGAGNIGRLGADEFVVALPCVSGQAEAVSVAERMQEVASAPMTLDGVVVRVDVSIGVALAKGGGSPAAELIQQAEIALHRARANGARLDVIDGADAAAAVEDLQLETRLEAALDGGGLAVAFQPIVATQGEVTGVEALVRWPGTELGASQVIAIAERSSQIRQLGAWVLDRSLAALEELSAAAGRPLRLSVNWSARRLHFDGLPGLVAAACARHGVDPSQVCIELTETTAMLDRAATVRALQELRSLGVTISIDDFGIGYSSFAYLQDLPVDEVKLDRSFVQQAGVEQQGVDILEGMSRLCRGLGLAVIGEGVENEHELAIVMASGCTGWQGYLFARPMASADLAALLRLRSADQVPDELTDLDRRLTAAGLVDVLVFKRIVDGRYAHIGGRGRGEGWAGIVEVDLAGEPQVAKLLRRGGQAVHCADAPFHVLGPYYATSAAVLEIGDQLVVLGHPTQRLEAEDLAAAALAIARAAVAEVVAVSPAKPLADELEVLQAVQSLLNFGGSGSAEALAHLLAVVVASLSCEVGLAWLPQTGAVGHGIEITDRTGARLAEVIRAGPRCVQHAMPEDLPDGLVRRAAIQSWYAVPIHEVGGVVLVGHTDAGPRGFTGLCQRLGRTLVDSSSVLFRSAAAREDLRREVAMAATEARTDALTGLLNRKGWDEQLGAHSRSGACGVVVIDLNDFKELNDRYGHGAGDSALRDVADLLTSVAPSGAVIARTGGDEFAILLLDVSEDETDAVGDRLSGRIHITDPLIDMVVTVAVGTAWTPGGAQLPHAVTGADRMMYVDKAAARAR